MFLMSRLQNNLNVKYEYHLNVKLSTTRVLRQELIEVTRDRDRPTTQCVYNVYETSTNRSFVHVIVQFWINLTLFLKRNRFPVCITWRHNSYRLTQVFIRQILNYIKIKKNKKTDFLIKKVIKLLKVLKLIDIVYLVI